MAVAAALCSAGAESVTVEEPGDALEEGVIAPIVVSLITAEGSAVPERSAEERPSRALIAVLGRDVVPPPAARAPEAMLGAASLADESDGELGSDSDESSGVVSSTAEDRLVSDPLDESRAEAPRDPRFGALVDPAPADEEPEAFPPVEPAEPVVSAKAIGIDPIAEPTPNATANAPTRPTYREWPKGVDSVVFTARLPYWMVRTHPFAERRWLLFICDDESMRTTLFPRFEKSLAR